MNDNVVYKNQALLENRPAAPWIKSHSTDRVTSGNPNCHDIPNMFSLLHMHKGILTENVI